jgi:xanthine dehydrogenase/oxidase
MIQIAAHALGTTVDKVYISETSTDKVPNSSPTAASASSDMYGMAVLDACNQLKKRLDEVKERLGDKLTDHSFDSLVRTAYFERTSLTATGFYATPNLDNYTFDGRPGTPFAYYTYGIAVSEVEIDVLNGDFQVGFF